MEVQTLGIDLGNKVRFTPTDLPSGERTYRFDANLSMGRLLGSVAQNSVGVPNGSQLEPASCMAAGN